MKKAKLLLAVLGTMGVLPALAEEVSQSPVTANASLVSNYLFRGISRTAGKPAIQAGFDYANPGGFYVGVWGSSISWLSDKGTAANSGTELDTYVGFKNAFAKDYTYDFGFVRYNFPGTYALGATTADTNEAYAAVGYKWVAFKYSYDLGNAFGIVKAKGSNYLDLSANYPIEDTGISVGAHYGKQTYKGNAVDALVAAGQNPSYHDVKLSVSADLNGYVFTVAYSETNTAKGAGYYYNVLGKDLGKRTAIMSLSRTF